MLSDPLVVPLRSRKRQRGLMVQKFQHAAPALALLLQGLSTLGSDPHGFALVLAIVEIVAAGLVIVAMVRALRAAPRPAAHTGDVHVHGVDWVDIAVAGLLAAEALGRWHLTHHVPRPTIVTAVAMLVLGLAHGRIFAAAARRFTIRAGDDELYIGGGPFRAFRARWEDIASIDVTERWATVRTTGGRERRINLADVEDPGPARRLLEVARARVGSAS
jgi:hypothetical protein